MGVELVWVTIFSFFKDAHMLFLGILFALLVNRIITELEDAEKLFPFTNPKNLWEHLSNFFVMYLAAFLFSLLLFLAIALIFVILSGVFGYASKSF